MSDYIDRDQLCYGLEKIATVDGQPRAIRRAKRFVEMFPSSDVRKIGFCKDCSHWDVINKHLDTSGNVISGCTWFSRNGNTVIYTSTGDFCSFYCKWKYQRRD